RRIDQYIGHVRCSEQRCQRPGAHQLGFELTQSPEHIGVADDTPGLGTHRLRHSSRSGRFRCAREAFAYTTEKLIVDDGAFPRAAGHAATASGRCAWTRCITRAARASGERRLRVKPPRSRTLARPGSGRMDATRGTPSAASTSPALSPPGDGPRTTRAMSEVCRPAHTALLTAAAHDGTSAAT